MMEEQTSKSKAKVFDEIEKGIRGENESLDIGLPKLGRYMNIRKRILTLIFSNTGAG